MSFIQIHLLTNFFKFFLYSWGSTATRTQNKQFIVTMVNNRVLFDQHMIEFGHSKTHAKANWTEPLRIVVGDFLQRNSFLHMISKAMYAHSFDVHYQFQLQYYGDTAIVNKEKKTKLVNFFIKEFDAGDEKGIKQIIDNSSGIKSLSLICHEHPELDSFKRPYHIISSVLFEYTHNGAYIHYLATSRMNRTAFTLKFIMTRAKPNNFQEYMSRKFHSWKTVSTKKLNDGVLLNLDQHEGRQDKFLYGKGIGRFMLYFVQIISFCRNEKYELDLKSSAESIPFYEKCNFVKATVKSSQSTMYSNLKGMRCESVISMKTDDDMSMFYLENRHEALLTVLNKRTLKNQSNCCYMISCFQLLSYSFKGITSPSAKAELSSVSNSELKAYPKEFQKDIQKFKRGQKITKFENKP